MTREELKEMLCGVRCIITVRAGVATVFLGFVGAPENFYPFEEEELENACYALEMNGVKYTIERKTECGYRRVSLKVKM